MAWLTHYRLAVRELDLSPGERVVDTGYGTGLSLPLIEEAVGPTGQVVGVEQSPEMIELARLRVSESGWTNVSLVPKPVQEAELPEGLDAALFCLTHDVVRMPEAVANVLGSLRPGGRFVSLGPRQWHAIFEPANAIARSAIRRSMTTFEGLHHPWTHLEAGSTELRVRRLLFGWLYLAVGNV